MTTCLRESGHQKNPLLQENVNRGKKGKCEVLDLKYILPKRYG